MIRGNCKTMVVCLATLLLCCFCSHDLVVVVLVLFAPFLLNKLLEIIVDFFFGRELIEEQRFETFESEVMENKLSKTSCRKK